MSTDAQKHGNDAAAHKTEILLPLLLPAFPGVLVNSVELLPVACILVRLSRTGREKEKYNGWTFYTNLNVFQRKSVVFL